MNKIIFFTSLIAVLTITTSLGSLLTDHTAASGIQHELDATVKAMQLPADTVVPDTLPTTIQDPTLLEGWIRLYNSTQNCEIWDGYTITGQELAQYVLDQSVVVAWNTSTTYTGSWVDRNDIGIVYINTDYKKENEMQMNQLVRSLSHEIFHHSNPFNQPADTMYEEYWAYFVGTCVSGQSAKNFENVQPLSSASLTEWFNANGHGGYLGMYDMYPENVVTISLP